MGVEPINPTEWDSPVLKTVSYTGNLSLPSFIVNMLPYDLRTIVQLRPIQR
jgi:hypothetical protein